MPISVQSCTQYNGICSQCSGHLGVMTMLYLSTRNDVLTTISDNMNKKVYSKFWCSFKILSLQRIFLYVSHLNVQDMKKLQLKVKDLN